jgi:hypothetical protein
VAKAESGPEVVPSCPDPRWSFAGGCLFGILCGIAGAVLGGYWGFRLDNEWHAARLVGREHLVDDWVPQWTILWIFFGGPLGWAIGWLLTALLPRKRRRTLGDYLMIVVCGLFPAALCAILLWWITLSGPRPVPVR